MQLAKKGRNIVLVSRTASKLEAVAAEIQAAVKVEKAPSLGLPPPFFSLSRSLSLDISPSFVSLPPPLFFRIVFFLKKSWLPVGKNLCVCVCVIILILSSYFFFFLLFSVWLPAHAYTTLLDPG